MGERSPRQPKASHYLATAANEGSTTTSSQLLRMLLISSVIGVMVAGMFVPAAAFAKVAVAGVNDFLTTVPSSMDFQAPAQATTMLASDGSTIATLYAQDRKVVDFESMSPFIKDGVVAIEDARFYEHGGVDPTGIIRALVATINGGRQGASTITQQYVNNMLIEQLVADGKTDEAKLGMEKTVADKVTEIQLAIGLEKKLSKDDILAGYLNIIYFGNGAYGIEAAAKLYFNTTAKDLTLPQAAALAGVVNRPTYYDPITQPENVVTRRNAVLAKLLDQKKISQADYDAAVQAPLDLHVTTSSQGCAGATAAYFCDYVQQLILNDPAYGATLEERTKVLYQGGLTIQTTLDSALQKVAQEQATATMSATDPLQRGAAIVSVQPGTGKVLTMAQNTVYNPAEAPGNYMGNFAVSVNDANGQPLHGAGGFPVGSTFKPFVFAEWLNSGHSMMTSINGAVRRYPSGYPWTNSCGTTKGDYDPAVPGSVLLPNDDPNHYYPMSAYEGLYNSINTVTFQTATALDFCNIQKMATAAGVKDGRSNEPYDLSSIANLLGTKNVAPLDMATAFATFASGGTRCNPIALTAITGANGTTYPVPAADCKRTISADVAAGVTYALRSVLQRGSGWNIPLDDKNNSFAKTGTTDGNIETWTIGGNSGVVTASFFGSYKGNGAEFVNQDIVINGKYYAGVDGADLAGGQWAAVMNAAATNPAYAASELVNPPAEMLAYTAPLVAGFNDPKSGAESLPVTPQVPAQPQDPSPQVPAVPQATVPPEPTTEAEATLPPPATDQPSTPVQPAP